MLATQCPACQTIFRVTREQLTVRQGSVRCGHCGGVFDAISPLSYLSDQASSEKSPVSFEGAEIGNRIDSLSEPAVASTSHFSPADNSETRHKHVLTTRVAKLGKPSDNETTEIEHASNAETTPQELLQTSFLVPPEKLRNRAVYSFALLIGALLLLGQGMYTFRDGLAAYWPASRPGLTFFCAYLKCEVRPLRQSEAISIEASDLQTLAQSKDVYTLNLVLRNHSAFSQQMPALEVWLTDLQNQPVVRRIFLPKEYLGVRQDMMRTGLAPDMELPIRLHWQAETLQATGYRVYLFYP